MIDFDVRHRPARPSEWNAFLDAVFNAHASDEAVWVEWKSVYDWENKSHLGKLSRQILGMANRQPADAAPFFDGSGLVIIGLEPGTVHGVTAIDSSVLEAKLRTYIGDEDGPRWQPHWLTHSSKTVLVIEVAAPRPGDPPFTLRTGVGGDYKPSQVFIRTGSSTDPATQAQLELLVTRARPAAEEPSLDIEITAVPTSGLPRYSWDSADLEQMLQDLRDDMLKSIPSTPTPGSRGFQDALRIASEASQLGAASLPDDRTQSEYRAEVQAYIQAVRASFPEVLHPVGAVLVPAVSFLASNQTNRNFKDVRVSIKVEGDAVAIDHSDQRRDLQLDLPRRPRPFGPRPNPIFDRFSAPPFLGVPQYASPTVGGYTAGRRDIRNGGSFEIDIDEFDLRPGDKALVIEDDVVILVPISRKEPVVVKWTATSSNIDAATSGSFEIEFDSGHFDLLDVARKNTPIS